MKTLKSTIARKNIVSTVLTICLTVLAIWYGMHFPGPVPTSVRADTDNTFPIDCTSTPTPTPITDTIPLPPLDCAPTPTPYPTAAPLENLPNAYQNPNNAKMAWIQYGGDSNHPKPGVLVIHGGGWNSGSAADNIGQTREIANAGFFAASVFYELAPNTNVPAGYIPAQPCHQDDVTTPGWRMKLEADDIKNAVKAMRADPRCNGFVAVVGGSAGATLAIITALDTNPSPNSGNDWPHWFQNGIDDRPNCAVMLSAIYDFADWTPPTGKTQTDQDYVHQALDNFAQTLSLNTVQGLPLNPVNLVPGAIAHGFKPIYMFNSYGEITAPYHQLVTMVCLLQSSGLTKGSDYNYITLPGTLHSFHYWGSWDHQPGAVRSTVSDDVIAFLKTQAGLP